MARRKEGAEVGGAAAVSRRDARRPRGARRAPSPQTCGNVAAGQVVQPDDSRGEANTSSARPSQPASPPSTPSLRCRRPESSPAAAEESSDGSLLFELPAGESFRRQVSDMMKLPEMKLPSMFEHMFQRQQSVVDERRRSVTLVDVVAECNTSKLTRIEQILLPFFFAVAYWYFLVPALRDWRAPGFGRQVESPQPRAGGPWAEVSWHHAGIVSACYLVCVFVGVQVMRRRRPVQRYVFEAMLIYNLVQALLNAFLAVSLLREAWHLGFAHPWGNGLDPSPAGHRLGMLIWVQYHLRQLELMDTVFVILRKKFHRMTFLHVYLRLVHMWGWFFACRFACGGDSYFPAAANSSCQVIVYLYYAMSMISAKGVPLVRKAHVTEVQVIQFVACATHATYVIAHGNLPRAVAAASLVVMMSGLALHVEWAGGQPHFVPRSRSPVELSMFGHMFENNKRLVDHRRRAITLIDVVSERQFNGPLRPHRLMAGFAASLLYWYFVLPALRDWGTNHYFRRELAEAAYAAPAGGPWSQVSFSAAALWTAVYLFGIRVGTQIMERRPPVQKRIFEYMVIYNVTQVMLNVALGFNIWREAYRLGYKWPWGHQLDRSPAGHQMGMLIWFHYHCRGLDLLDTVFVILRKKFHRMPALQIFVRLAHMWGWFFVCRYACGGDSYFPAAVNCTCQAIVYLYYALSMLQDHNTPLVRKAHVAEVQLAQFALCTLHACFVLVMGNLPRAVAALSLFVVGFSLVMHSDFAGDLPKLSGVRSEVKGRLTFRFDSSGWLYCYHFGVALWLQEHLIPEGLTAEEYSTEKYPEGLAFAGSSGGALVACTLATGINVRELFEHVMSIHGQLQTHPNRLYDAVGLALDKFMPPNSAKSMSGRLRILLTEISARPPFITADVVDHFDSRAEVIDALRASSHVPGLNLFPYKLNGRYYFDGLLWSSMLVPWGGGENDHVVKVSATATPLTDIRAPVSPAWWTFLPPSVETLRGLFWTGYRDAAIWFAESPDAAGMCGCRAPGGRPRRGSSKGSPREETPPGTPTEERQSADPLSTSRHAKHLMAQRLLLKQPASGPDGPRMPEIDPACGKSVEELMRNYRRAADQNLTAALALGGAFIAVAAVGACLLGPAGWVLS